MTGPGRAEKLESSAGNIGRGDADRLETHIIRRGAAGTISVAGGSFAQLSEARQRHSSACRLFIDAGAEGPKAMAPLPIEASVDQDKRGSWALDLWDSENLT